MTFTYYSMYLKYGRWFTHMQLCSLSPAAGATFWVNYYEALKDLKMGVKLFPGALRHVLYLGTSTSTSTLYCTWEISLVPNVTLRKIDPSSRKGRLRVLKPVAAPTNGPSFK